MENEHIIIYNDCARAIESNVDGTRHARGQQSVKQVLVP
jgi:hypothetical protein